MTTFVAIAKDEEKAENLLFMELGAENISLRCPPGHCIYDSATFGVATVHAPPPCPALPAFVKRVQGKQADGHIFFALNVLHISIRCFAIFFLFGVHVLSPSS